MQNEATDREMCEMLETALAGLVELNGRLRRLNDELIGRKPRPELRLLQGGRTEPQR